MCVKPVAGKFTVLQLQYVQAFVVLLRESPYMLIGEGWKSQNEFVHSA